MINVPSEKILEISQSEKVISDKLAEIISAEIISTPKGNIPFSRYMELALYHPIYGYYNNARHKFGGAGDYITSSTSSEIFGIAFSNQFKELFNHNIKPEILELGAGNGHFMVDILQHLGDSINQYYILELSTSLAKLQKELLISKLPQYVNKVIWLNALPDDFEGIVFANELLDAIPCDSIICQNEEIYSHNVGIINSEFHFMRESLAIDIKDVVDDLPIPKEINGYITEVNTRTQALLRSLSKTLKRGVIFLVDYGYGHQEFYSNAKSSGTVRGFFKHHLISDVLKNPGLVDITSSVNFSVVAETLIATEIDLIGYVTQANFLLNCDILDNLKTQMKKLSSSKYLELTNQVNRLTSPNQMGDAFKVISFSKNIDFADFMGFRYGDKTYTL